MFEFAFLIGIYSYIIFFLGIFGLLYKNIIILFTLAYILLVLIYFKKSKKLSLVNLIKNKLNLSAKIIILLLLSQVIINFIGVLGPEISFDALWYHLTLPKIFLNAHSIFHIPGNLLYYSSLPKLTEMYYITSLSFGSEIIAKLIHFGFGILTLVAIYKLARKFISIELSLLACLIFYSNLVVGWESITAYIDLSRAFFEILSLWAFFNWYETKKTKWIIYSMILLGLAVSAKLIALGSLIIFATLLIYLALENKKNKVNIKHTLYLIIPLLISLPWLIISYIQTGSFIYPYFSSIPVDSGNIFLFPNILNLPKDIYSLFFNLNDPISPIYLIIIPIIILKFTKLENKAKLLILYCFGSLTLWYLTQQGRGGRFLLPYLPAFSIVSAYAITLFNSNQFKKLIFLAVVLVSIISIGYRGIANFKFVPVILGSETKQEFLSKHLNFSFGDFYDTDFYFKNNLNEEDKVLLYGFHNLYYVNFPFIDSSFAEAGDKFNYIATQNSDLPDRFKNWKEVYNNSKTHVRLYSAGGKQWVY